MTRWQRHARLGLGLFALAFAAALFFIIGDRQQQRAVEGVDRLDPKAIAETKEGQIIQLKGDARDITVEFGSQILYEDGRTKLNAFKAVVANRGGRSYTITGHEAWLGTDRSSYDLRGGVELNTSDGFNAKTPEATFVEAEGVVRSNGPVTFNRGRMSGSGVGFTYDKQTDRLWLLDQAKVRIAPEGDAPGMEVESGSAGHSRAERYMRFERGMRMTREGQIVEANESTVFLLPDRDEPDRIELRGNAKVTGATGTGSVEGMQAQDINLDYAEDGRTLNQAVLSGESSIKLRRADGSAGQQLTGAWIDVSLAPDGAVTHIASRDNVRVTLPASADAPARTVTAAVIDGTGEAGFGLKQMTFDEGVEYREEPLKGGAGRVARARILRAVFGKTATIDQAAFDGGFQFEEGKFTATSAKADYDLVKGRLRLSSPKGAVRPHLADDRLTVDADAVDVSLSPRSITASGTVSTVLQAGRRRDGERGTTLLKEDEAVSITADSLEFDDQASRGTYKGKARLFQGPTSISADTITMDDRQGSVLANGKVVTSLPIAGKKEEGRETHSIARAEEFRFEDAKRRAAFSRGAQFDGAQGVLSAQHIELMLVSGDNGLSKIEARDEVKIVVDKREATGKTLVYNPIDQSYLLSGAPVKIVISGCRETTGKTLQFFAGSDRLIINSQENRTQTKGDSTCPEPPRD